MKQSISEMDLATSTDVKELNRIHARIEDKLTSDTEVKKPAGFVINAG